MSRPVGNDATGGIWSDGATMWVMDNPTVQAYDLATRTRAPSLDFTVDYSENGLHGIWSDATTTMWVSEYSVLRAYDLPAGVRRPAFTDPRIVAGTTTVKAVHLTELRLRINALRRRYGLSPFSWTDRTITRGVTPVRGVHVAELRWALGPAQE